MILQKRTLVLLLSFLILLQAKILPHGAPDHVVWLAGKDELIFLLPFLPRGALDVGPDELIFHLILLSSLILPRDGPAAAGLLFVLILLLRSLILPPIGVRNH